MGDSRPSLTRRSAGSDRAPIAIDELRSANPFADVTLHESTYGSGSGSPAIRIDCVMPDSADVTHHPFQAEIDDFVDAILDRARDDAERLRRPEDDGSVPGRRPVGRTRRRSCGVAAAAHLGSATAEPRGSAVGSDLTLNAIPHKNS